VVFLTTVFEEVDTGPGIYANYLWRTFRNDPAIDFHVVAPWFAERHQKLHAVGTEGGSLALYRRLQDAALELARAPGAGTTILHGNSTHCMGRVTRHEGPLLTQVNDYETATLPRTALPLFREAGLRKLVSTVWRYREERRVLRHATIALCNSEFTAETVSRSFGLSRRRFRVVHKAVDTSVFQRPIELPADPMLGWSRGSRLVFVGADWRRKGLDVLITALADLAGRGVNATLAIVGPDACDRDLNALIDAQGLRESVHLVGRASRDVLTTYCWHSDVFVLPSRREALGVAVLEGMAAGLPIVATKTGGIPEMVRSGTEGYLVEPGSAQELAAALRRVLDDPQRRLGMGTAGIRRAREFSAEAMTSAIREIYLQVSLDVTHVRSPTTP
jgi:glycosyltransferase involved in cell wall biosynthesis